ncbi:MAG: T9SS type A sorting domain-containing protein [Sphingobacteriales bacterium]|nr:MAG: T9SS type A sorting domain-containing protein [Sphingobacteriales bacterium]
MKRFVPSRSLVAGFILSTIALFQGNDAFAQPWYLDSDNDGWGDINTTSMSMSKPAGYVRNSLDCDDGIANGQIWNVVDGRGFSSGQISYTSLATSLTGTPYMAYRDAANSNKVSVMMLNAGSWTPVGSSGFSAGAADNISLSIDNTGVPYVAYRDGAAGNRLTVKKFDGTNWVTVGVTGFSAGQATFISMDIDGSGTPYVAYRDVANSSFATVMMFNGTNWVAVGGVALSGGVADNISLAIDGANMPYIAYRDGANGNAATVKIYDGANWVGVGSAALSAGQATYLSLAFNSGNTPYLAYRDAFNANKATVMMFDGADWVTVGAAGFSSVAASYLSLAIDPDDMPYLGYSTTTKAYVMKFDGTNWVSTGNLGATPGNADYTSLAINNVTGIPYLGFRDKSNSNAATVTVMAPDSLHPSVTIASDAVANTICNATSVTFTATPVNGGASPDYQWKKNGVAVGTNSDTYTDAGLNNNDTITVDIVNSELCFSVTPVTSNIIKMTVKPIPVISALPDIERCNGSTTGHINFTSTVGGTTYAWTNDNTSIGLAANGTGTRINSFATTNAMNTDIVGNISVTPTANGCTGLADDFTITVKPTPTVNTITNQVVCNGDMTDPINFTGFVGSTTYSWTNNNASIGLAASGTGDIAAFTATNTTTTPVTATITVVPTANGCAGTSKTFTIRVNPTPTINAVADLARCNGASTGTISFSGSVSGTTYAWVNNNISIGLPAGGTGNISSFAVTNATNAPATATISVTPTANSCSGASDNFTITVNPTPTVDAIPNQTVCNTDMTTAVNFTGFVGSSTYSWTNNNTSIGLGASGTGDIAAFTATNASTSAVVSTINVTPSANSCTGTSKTFTIRVNPTPTVNATADMVRCNGATTATISFAGTVSGTTYNWTNNTPSIGLAAAGAGTISSFSATNTGNMPVVATVVVTPVANSCSGTPDNFNITVNPTPSINAVPGQSVCNGDMTTTVNFGGPVSGTSIAWTNNRTSIGLAASGTGDIAAFPGTNTGNSTVTATITAVPTANSCIGTSEVFTIAVKPTPTVNTIANQTKCNGAATNTVTFGGAVTGSTYNWTNDNTAIGLAANGTGDITSFTANNNTNAPITATITVTPVANGCNGLSKNFTITVNPTPTVNTIADQELCNGATTSAVSFSGPVSGTTYTWTNNNTAINLSSSGAGNINPFAARNTTNAPITGTITVTPKANNCTGTPGTFDILVNPTPKVDVVASQVLCNASMTNPVDFTGPVTGTAFTWTNTTTSIGLSSGNTGDIAAFTAINNTTSPVTATITVTPSANNCTGSSRTFTIKVNPTTTVNTINNIVRCNGTATGSVVFSSPVSGTSYAWANSDTSIGLAASGNGNIASFEATNSTNAPITATITITPTANSCVGTPNTFTITVNPTPTVDAVANQVVCNGANTAAVTFSGPVAGTSFAWANNNSTIGLAASGTGNIGVFAATNNGLTPVTSTINITPSANGCTGPVDNFTIRVNPTPTMNPLTSLTKCNGAASGNINFSGGISGTTYTWVNNTPSIGLPSNGTGNISSFATVNTGTAPVTATITVTPSVNGCPGASGNFTITVNPTPNANVIADQSICNAAPTTAVNFTGSVPGTTFNWTNNRPTIGLAGSGSGNISSFTAVNTGNSPVTATITITPSANACNGATETFTITVNPTPTVANIANQTRCNGAATNDINFSGAVSGTVFTWTNSNSTIGLASNGTGDIASFNTINSGVTPVTSTIVVTPTANGCAGATKTFTITVNPTPTINPTGDQTLCVGASTTPVNFTGTVTGTAFNWTNDRTSIGLASSGTGNIGAFTASNSSSAPLVATITVIPTANNCSGSPDDFTITVNPTPTVNNIANQTKCNGDATNTISFAGPVSGTTFTWTNTTTSIGLAANGNGDINSFTAANTTNVPVTATITVTPSANGCTGNPKSFTIKVNPTPIVTTLPDIARCNSALTIVTLGSSVGGTTYLWTNSDTSIGLADSGTRNISFRAKNTTFAPVIATINVTPTAAGCIGAVEQFLITVNPTPTIDTTWSQVLCNNAITDSVWFKGPVAGTTFAWVNNRPSIGLAATGNGDIPSFVATNTSTSSLTAAIRVTPTANSCVGIDSVFTIRVHPTPTVRTINPQVYCNQKDVDTIFIASPVTGATFTWINSNPAVGIGENGTDFIPAFTATNAEIEPISAKIVMTPSANGCIGTKDSFTVTVNPTPLLSSEMMLPTMCAGLRLSYTPTSQTSNTTFKWKRLPVQGIIPVSNSDSGSISEVLRNNTLGKLDVSYIYTLTANGCQNDDTVSLSVEPRPEVARIATRSLTQACGNTFFQNFSADTIAPPGIDFTWIGTNAIVHATSTDKKNCLVSFFNPGEAKVYLYAKVDNFVCESIDSVTVNISETTAHNPRVIYHNERFLCLDNSLASYQWGYEQKGSLDSVLFETETNQDYYEPSPDFTNRHYFVITTKNGCFQKNYYNAPTAIQEIRPFEAVTAKVYPNPASQLVTIEISDKMLTKVTTGIMDLSGRLLKQNDMANGKTTFDIGELPAGVYTVVCHSNGTRIAVTKFIKN